MKKKQLTLIAIILLLTNTKENWRHIPKYSKTLGYVITMNCLYYYLSKRRLVWEFAPGRCNWRLLRAIHIFIVTPLIVLSFLSKYPKSIIRQVFYIVNWVIGSTALEHFIAKRKMIKFKYGWNIAWSGLIYLKMYVYSVLFTKKPVSTLLLSICSTIFFIVRFKLPLSTRLLKGPLFLFVNKTNALID